MERTLVFQKPDVLQRGLSGEIISRFEGRGLKLVAMKLMAVSRELASWDQPQDGKEYSVARPQQGLASCGSEVATIHN